MVKFFCVGCLRDCVVMSYSGAQHVSSKQMKNIDTRLEIDGKKI